MKNKIGKLGNVDAPVPAVEGPLLTGPSLQRICNPLVKVCQRIANPLERKMMRPVPERSRRVKWPKMKMPKKVYIF